MLRFFCFLAFLIAASLSSQLTATAADKRVALVIGISAYQNVSALPNPSNDASAVAALLKSSGFDVVETRRDVGIAQLRRAIGDFSEQAQTADVAVVFYAGHGIEVDGTNYLVPADAKLARDFDIEDEALSLDRLLKAIEPARRLRLVILDACRDNPFAKTMKRTVASRSVGRGLAKIEPTVADTLIAYAAKAGSTALDGDEANSPFTKALLANLATPGLDLRIAFGRVRDAVLASTARKQEPFVYGSLGGSTVSIVDAAATPVTEAKSGNKPAANPQVAAAPSSTQTRAAPESAQAPVSATNEAAEAWRATLGTTSPAVLEAYVKRFGDTVYGDLARARLSELKAAAPKTEPRAVQPEQRLAATTAAPSADGSKPLRYIGCFRDSGKRDLDGPTSYDGKMTPQLCVATCAKAGFAYAGVQYAGHCFCGNTYGAHGAAQNCDTKCTGDRDQICGGTWANAIYATN
jgi:uncharacterized caspase-like protein